MLLNKRRNKIIKIKTTDKSETKIRLMNNMQMVPTDISCLLPCATELEKIKNKFVEEKTCDDIEKDNRNFYQCYIR